MAYEVAVDVGGTFTDGVLLERTSGRIRIAKALTTHADPGAGIAQVVSMLLGQLDPRTPEVTRVVHGTTLITNSLLERKGVRTALVVTRGTEDALDIRRELRYDSYDLTITFPDPLVPPALRFGLAERTGPDGSEWAAIDEADLARICARIVRADVGAVAICLLHACVDGTHERRVREALQRAAPGRSCSISSEVASEVGEYERMSTVAANAYVQPVVARYLDALGERLKSLGVNGRLDIMVSNGGFTDAAVAARFPIQLLESGPAGGVLSAVNCGSLEGHDAVLAFDMGGTTAKSCVSIAGDPSITHLFEFARVSRFKKGSGLPALTPSIDLIEIGAGGGSIARINELGLLQVGPESSGSEPGPACYGLGGVDPTVTDADLILGYLDADRFLGGTMKLDVAAAQAAVDRLGDRLGLSGAQVAVGIHDIVNENMASAARAHIAEKGHDARSFTFVTTGGAGPVHAVDVARRLRIRTVLCPIASGVGSCLGFLAAPARADRSWSKIERIGQLDQADLAARIAQSRREIARELEQVGLAEEAIVWRLAAEARYVGQGARVEVDCGAPSADGSPPDDVARRFEAEYARLYRTTVPGGVPEVVTWRMSGMSARTLREFAFAAKPAADAEPSPIGQRNLYLPAAACYRAVPVYDRYALPAGADFDGPAVLVEPETTLVVSHPARITMLPSGTVRVVLKEVAA
ncbi:MAG: hydantoinase/oxoprolinase family protein [Lautropia sp.]